MGITSRLLLAPALVALVGGCAAVKPHDSFPAVADDVTERLPQQRVHWHDGSPADREADAQIAALLGRPLDAAAAVQVALLNNRHLQATYEDLGVAQADLVQAGLLRNPVFDAAYKFGEAGATGRFDVALTFDFLDLLFLGVRKEIAAAELETTKARVTASVIDLAADVTQAFHACQAAQQAVELREQVTKATAASAEFAKRLRDAGNTTALANANEQALHVEAELALDRAKADATAARERLSRLLGVWGGQADWTLAGRMPEPSGDEPTVEEVQRRALERSLDLRIGRAIVSANLKTLGIARPLGVLSELEAGVAADREDGTWYTGPTIALPVPLFSQGQPAVARAVAKVRQAEAAYYATAVDLRSTVRQTHARVVTLRRQVDRAKQSLLPLRQEVVEQTQLHYNAMQIGTFELLAAKRAQIEAGDTYLRLLRDYWSARSDLDRLIAGRIPTNSQTASAGDDAMPASSSGAAAHD